ncbi:MAG: DNA polymerase I, partial [Alphaproteobacteria bacterium]|nr:DNA polymerase I [Alphaproteobacteria bacterium]
ADSTDPLRANLVGLALATAPGRACYVPVQHTVLEAQLAAAQVLGALAPLFGDPAVLKVFHDAKAAMLALARAGGGAIGPVDDTMLISYAQEAGAHGHDLPELSSIHLHYQPVAIEQVTGSGRARVAFADAPLERATTHAAEAADITLRLWHALRPKLREKKSLAHYEQIDRRLLRVLAEMERCGIKVDADDLRRMSSDFSARMAIIEQEIFRLAGREFTLGSPKQLGEILFDEQKLGGSRRTKTGAHGTDAAILQQLADEGHELPARVLDWRQLAKLKSTYADALVDEINPETGRVHTSFAMAVASTGRLSSNNPNLQNIPIRTEEGSRIRRAFIAEAGHVLVSADYSQIELRLLAHVAEIPALRESFSRGGDIHARTASEVFGIPMAGMDALTRRRAKAINFGIIYGISAFGLGRQLGVPPGEAKLYIDAYFARYPGIRDYMERTKEEARIAGYVLTPFGRRCWIPGIAERNPTKRGYAERQAINAPLQGGAADIIKRAMVRLPAALAEAGLRARLLLQVHDELLFEAPEAEAIDTARVARDVMERAARLSVPLVAETGIGRTWAEAH